MKINNAKFLISVSSKNGLLNGGVPEIAFVGKSNVGKSSLINCLVNQKNLAKASSMPGRTRLVNYFAINDGQVNFVDLPGYGFAKAPKETVGSWQDLLETYLSSSKNLKLVVFLLDIRHDPTELDKIMHAYLYINQLPYIIVATKSDKLAKSKVKNSVNSLATKLKIAQGNVFAFSSETQEGKQELLEQFDKFLN